MINAFARLDPSRVIQLLAGSLLLAVAVSAQAQQDLILETEPEITIIPLQGTLRLDDDGRVIATPVDTKACQATSSCEGVDVELSTFSANNEETSLSVDQGKSIMFRWSSRGAWGCEATGDLPGWSAGTIKPQFATGTQETVSTSSISQGSYTAGLLCTNGSVASQTRDVDITVNVSDDPEPEPTDCPSNRQPPEGWRRQSNCTLGGSDCTDLGAVFGGTGNITDGNLNREQILLNRNTDSEYVAMEFNTNGMESTFSGSMAIESTQGQASGYTSASKMITISSCPGDFNKSAILDAGECYFEGDIFTPLITIGTIAFGGSASSRSCTLDPDQTYYLNILYTNSAPGTNPDDIQPSTCGNNADGCGNQWSP